MSTIKDQQLFDAVGFKPDRGARSWAKHVIGVDPTKHGGYALLGDFVAGEGGLPDR